MTNYNQPIADAKKFTDTPEVKAVVDDAKSLAKNTSNLVSSAKEEGVKAVKEGKHYFRDMAQKDFEAIKTYMKEHPGKSIAFAALGGFILSRFLGGSNK